MTAPLAPTLLRVIDDLVPELVDFRRDLHAHPELSFREHRTTAGLRERPEAAGLAPRSVSETGLVVDPGASEPRRRVALRGDIDALPVRERTGPDWTSTVDGVCHACGHDVHATVLPGAGLALAEVADELARRASCRGPPDLPTRRGADARWRPEVRPVGGDVRCRHGLRRPLRPLPRRRGGGPARGSAHGRGRPGDGHAARAGWSHLPPLPHRGPHLCPSQGHHRRPGGAESTGRPTGRSRRRVGPGLRGRGDQRHPVHRCRPGGPCGCSTSASGTGSVRSCTRSSRTSCGPYGVAATIDHVRGVPPVVNDPAAVAALGRATMAAGLRPVPTPHSLGGEDFAWMLHEAEGAMARLGTRTHGGRSFDLHRGDLVVDEGAVPATAPRC
uniref:Amidohydrolase n=1 Tax=Janibacter limosus TaxID=53458 RepID=A0AC61U1Z3_9MICO|nr:M20/M25/M40 family metallo-hydrolase [Janibacter limosus]